MNNSRPMPLTLEQRLELAARSQAVSPEAALRLVQRFSRTSTPYVFSGPSDLTILDGLIGEFLERVGDDIMLYFGFCRGFRMAIAHDCARAPRTKAETRFRPVLGARVNNAIVLLGLMLLDHTKGRLRDKNIYHCTRMTFGQYLNALPVLYRPQNKEMERQFQTWRDRKLKSANLSAPLGDVLADIIRQYIAGWRMLGPLDHILNCMKDFSRYQKQERLEEPDQDLREATRQVIPIEDKQEHYEDPCGHFLSLAQTLPEDVPDPAAGGTASRAVRDQIFLSRWDYSPQTLTAMAKNAPSPEFRALLEEHIDPERLEHAMTEINEAVSNLFMMWLAPYIEM